MSNCFLSVVMLGAIPAVVVKKDSAKQSASAKLFLVRDVVRGVVFRYNSSRRKVMAAVVHMVQHHLSLSR